MSAIDRHLVPGESVRHRARPHGIVLLPSLFLGTVLDLAGAGCFVAAFLRREAGGISWWLAGPGIVLLVAASVVMAIGVLKRSAIEIAVTDRRVIVKTGVFTHRTTEVLLAKLESVDVTETFAGRILGFGTVTIRGTGGTAETFHRIALPLELRKEVQKQIEAVPPRTVRIA